MNADGWVIIGTDLDTKKFDAKLKEVEGELNQLQEKQKILQKYNQASDKRKQGSIVQYTEENLKELHKYGLTLDDIGNKDTWTKLASQIETLSNKYVDLSRKSGMKSIEEETKKINLNIDKAVKKVGRWALAVFGVRGAYSAIRKAVSTVSQYNEQIGADINYMSMALASVLEPVVKRIVELAHTLLVYIGYIIKQWTGYNIFKNANKYLQKSVGSAKQLRKELAGFDEMNIIGDTSAESDAALPSFNLANPEDVPIPSWLKWIADNKDVVIAGLMGIAGGLSAIKLGYGGIRALGIGLAMTGAVELIQDLISYLDKLDGSLENNGTSWEDFGKILKDIGLIILGVGTAIGSLPLAIAGAIGLIVGYVLTNWETIKSKLTEAENWINSKLDWLENNLGILGSFIKGVFGGAVDYAKDRFAGLLGPIKNIVDGILLIFRGNFQDGIKSIFKGIANYIIGVINRLIDGFNLFLVPLRTAIIAVGKVIGKSWSMDNIKIPRISYLAKGGIVNMPNRGVPVGNAFVGERGAEGVIPLTDSQQMQLLGEAIGKYITINNNITTTMNGRVISRELQKVQNDSNFAFNR